MLYSPTACISFTPGGGCLTACGFGSRTFVDGSTEGSSAVLSCVDIVALKTKCDLVRSAWRLRGNFVVSFSRGQFVGTKEGVGCNLRAYDGPNAENSPN